MPAQKLIVRPGINTEATPLLNETGWSASYLVRFFQGMLQKLGGWAALSGTPILGTARSMLVWEDAVSNGYIAIGSDKAFEVFSNGVLYNVTPIASTDTVTPSFSTIINTPTVKVTDASNPAGVGNYVYIENSISVGGLILQGSYPVTNVIDANNYDILAPSNATATATNTGAAALFTTTMSSSSVQVTLANHGLIVGAIFTVYVPTTVGGIALSGAYNVITFIDANNFTITGGTIASSGTTGSENGGNVTIQYLLASGPVSSSGQGGIYGAGAYGAGTYGTGGATTFQQARLWSFAYWGTDVCASYTGGPLYTWISEDGFIGNPATVISTAPMNIGGGIFTAMPQQQIIACGASDGSSSDPDQLLIRWCDIGDNTDWTATATNQAGSFRIPRGSHIVGGIQGPQSTLIWTDVGVWLMQYIGFPLVYGFTEIGRGCGLIGQNAVGVLAGKVYWMSFNQLYVYDGSSVQVIPCTVWDKLFYNLNYLQAAKIIAAPNSFFNEMGFCYPSNTGSGEVDSRVTYNAVEGTWTFDPPNAIIRTAWVDDSAAINPLGVDENGIIQAHETSPDANGQPMLSFAQTGYFKIGDGLDYTFIERLIPDAVLDGGATLQIVLFFQDYPDTAPITTIGPLNYNEATEYLIVRGRGRLVSILIGSGDLGSTWRLGEFLYFGSAAGRR
jgi:hypothetical protein